MPTVSRWTMLQMVYGKVLADLERTFASKGYRFMPIKGAYLIRTGLASRIADRKMRDIDLMVPEDQYSEIAEWFESFDNVTPLSNCWDFERRVTWNDGGRPVQVELHRLLNSPSRFYLSNTRLFRDGIQMSGSCIVPDPTDALLIHVCHKLLHIIDGFEEQFYREIDIYVQQDGFSWPLFWTRARETEIMAFIWLVLQKCNTLCGAGYTLPAAPSLYAGLLGRYDLFMRCRSSFGRRLFFEVPFVRDLLGLALYNIKRRVLGA